MSKLYPERLNRDFENTDSTRRIMEAYEKVVMGENKENTYKCPKCGKVVKTVHDLNPKERWGKCPKCRKPMQKMDEKEESRVGQYLKKSEATKEAKKLERETGVKHRVQKTKAYRDGGMKETEVWTIVAEPSNKKKY